MGKCLQQLLWECGGIHFIPIHLVIKFTFLSEALNLGVEKLNYDHDPGWGIDKEDINEEQGNKKF